MKLQHNTVLLMTVAIFLLVHRSECRLQNATLKISTHDAVVVVSKTEKYTIELIGDIDKALNISFKVSHYDLIKLVPQNFVFEPKSDIRNVTGAIVGCSPGHVEIIVSATPQNVINTNHAFIRVVVALSSDLINVSTVIGWCYFFEWSISFYLQIYKNFKRQSVIGLNFDYISLNIVGYVFYAVFNIGMFFIPEIQEEYSRRFPRGINPVHINDVFFASHATFATLIIISQCYRYDRGDQSVSLLGKLLTLMFILCGFLSAVLVTANIIHGLDFLYICSYVKLSITLLKYIPQAYMNYQRKSTSGWSIGNVMLDISGGALSMLQMVLNAYNYDDWVSIFGDVTKFGLGLFSVMFDILFLIQHYILYRQQKDVKHIPSSSEIPKTLK